jgi:hypothetical protein
MLRDLVRLLRAYVRERRCRAAGDLGRWPDAFDQSLRSAAAPDVEDEAPIFIFAAGWRSGSTLLQRLVMSDGGVLIWGEPYQESGLIQALAATLAAFRPGWPQSKWMYGGQPPAELARTWVANLFPPAGDYRNAHRALFETMFAIPARRAGVRRWGLKEVRLDATHARYLRWLYPNARFVFLHRDPLDAYASYRARAGNWRDRYPGPPTLTPTSFGRHWRRVAESFVTDGADLQALTVRYDDLVGNPRGLDAIDAHLGVRIDRRLLSIRVDPRSPHVPIPRIGAIERWLVAREAGAVAARLGYRC